MNGFSKGAVWDFLEQHFKGPVNEVEGVATIGTTLGLIAPPDPERFQLIIVNLGAAEVLISFNQEVSTSRGLRLGPNGGIVSMSVIEDGTLPSREWYGISPAAGNVVYWVGVRRNRMTEVAE